MRKIDIDDYRQSGEGANGLSYYSLSDPLEMVKLYNTGYPSQTIYDEYDVALKAFRMGVPSPDPGEIVTDGERIGIRFRRIEGKKSFSRLLADHPERTEELARTFAREAKALHSTECPEGFFPDAKQQFLHLLDEDKAFTPEEKGRIADFIRNVPDCSTALHGDLHMGNVVYSSEPRFYFIDMGYFSHGYPLFDLGMTMNICLDAGEDFRQHDFHVTGERTRAFWKYFSDEYFFSEDRLAEKYFGPGQTPESIISNLRPFECCKLLLVEYNLGMMLPDYERIIRETFYLPK